MESVNNVIDPVFNLYFEKSHKAIESNYNCT